MRRLWAFICMVLSLVVMVVFNVQSIYDSNNLSLEYTNSKEAVIQLTQRSEGINLEKDDIASKVSARLDLAGVNNSNVEVVMSDDTSSAKVRVKLSTNNDAEYENILRVVTSNTVLTFSNANNDVVSYSDLQGSEDNTMVLDYDGTTPQPKFVIGNVAKWNEFTAKNDEISDEDNKKKIFVWANKTDEDTYVKAFGDSTNQIEAVQDVRKKIIAILSTDDYSKADNEDVGYVKVNTDENENSFTIASARSYVNARNATDYGFDVKKLYDNRINPTLPTSSRNMLLIGSGVGLLLLFIGLLLAFSLNGLVAGLSITVSTMFTLLVSNFVGFVFTPVTCVAVLFTIISSLFVIIYTFTRIQQEFKKGRSIEKSHYEGFRKSFKINLIIGGLIFFTSLFTFFVGQGMIKVFCGYLVIGSIFSTFVTYYLTKWQSYWLFTSPKTNNNLALLGVNNTFTSKLETKVENKEFVNVDKVKNKKKINLSILCATCVLVLATFLTFGLVKGGDNIFNNQGDYKDQYRVDIEFVTDREVADSDTYTTYTQFANNIDASDSLKDAGFSSSYVESYTFNRVETFDSNNLKTYTTYISLLLKGSLDTNQKATLQAYASSNQFGIKLYQNTSVSIDIGTSYNGQIAHNNFYFYLASGLLIVFIIALYLLFFGIYAFGQVSIALAIEYGITLSLMAICRLPFNSFASFGVYFGILISGISFVPIFQRFRELKRENKANRAGYEDQIKLYNQAYKETFLTSSLIHLASLIIGLCCIFAGGSSLFSLGLIIVIMAVISYFYMAFVSYYDFAYLRQDIKYKRIQFKFKKKDKKKPIENKNEPVEAIVPGINDYF